jgi:hypothetical protein
LSLRWSYLPTIAPWLVRFIRAGTADKVHAQARALRPLVGATLDALMPLVRDAGAEDLVHRLGHLYVYRSPQGLENRHRRVCADPLRLSFRIANPVAPYGTKVIIFTR